MEQETRNIAVALAYNTKQDEAPKVVAKGQGEVADKIIEIARANSVPLKVDRELARLLYRVSLESAIPVSLYRLVAEVLAWVYLMDTQVSNQQAGGMHG